mgnify:CR=1 FL=1
MRQKQSIFSLFLLSPSSRRAWIEILPATTSSFTDFVALLAEGVDRNASTISHLFLGARRPPRGGRG